MTRIRRRGVTGPAQAGSATVFLLVMVPVFVILLGMVYDDGRAYVVHTRALNVAEQAARTGAQRLDLRTVREGGPYRIDGPAATSAAMAFLSTAAASDASWQPDSVSIGRDPVTGGDTVEVTVSWGLNTTFLGIIGITRMTGTASASARIAVGVDTEDR